MATGAAFSPSLGPSTRAEGKLPSSSCSTGRSADEDRGNVVGDSDMVPPPPDDVEEGPSRAAQQMGAPSHASAAEGLAMLPLLLVEVAKPF